MKTLTTIIASGLLLATITCINAQEAKESRFVGMVVDAFDRPIVEANVYGYYLNGAKGRLEASTDAKGAFELSRKQMPVIFLVFSQDRKLAGVKVSPANKNSITLVARPYISVSGRLVDGKTGAPLRNTELVYTAWYSNVDRSTTSFHHEETKTDAKGFFKFRKVIASGDARIAIVTKRGDRKMVTSSKSVSEFEISQREDFDVGRISPPRNWKPSTEIRMEGEIIDANGDPVAAASVYGFYLDGDQQKLEATTNAEGKFEVNRKTIPAAIIVRSNDRSLAGVVVSRAAEEAITIEALPFVAVTGQLVNGQSGMPMKDTEISYRVEYRTDDHMTRCFHLEETRTDAEGFFKLEKVVVGGDAKIHLIEEREKGGMAITFHMLKSFEVTERDDFNLGVVATPVSKRRLTIEERAAKLFADQSLQPRFELAVELAELSRRNILVVSSPPGDPELLRLLRLVYEQRKIRAWFAYRILFADPSTQGGSELMKSLGIERPSNELSMAVFGSDGQLVEAHHLEQLLDKQRQVDLEKVGNFLSKHVMDPLDAREVLDEAFELADQENKRILIQFSSSWQSQPCDRLTQFFIRNRNWEKDYVWVLIDKRWDNASEIMKQVYGELVPGFPWFAILDSQGNQLINSEANSGPDHNSREQRNIGFPDKSSDKIRFKKMLMDTKIRMNEQEIDELIMALDRK